MMDLSESMKIVSRRIQEIEPEHASKIVGYMLLHNYGDLEMIRLAHGPDKVIIDETNKVKDNLGLPPSKQLQQQQQQLVYAALSPAVNNPIQYCIPYQGSSDCRVYSASNMPLSSTSWNFQVTNNGLDEQLQRSLKLEDGYLDLGNSDLHSNYYCYPDHHSGLCGFSDTRACTRRSRSLIEFPPKVCHYFSKGFCKHGTNCRFFHGNPITSESFSQLLSFGSNDNGYGNGNDDLHVFPLGSLEKLEMDLIELLKSRNGSPVSIASLPMVYYEKYGRNLQAEGYLTESQRNGKAGYSLTRLLARLKNSICLIDRPHGQHSVILAEDAPKYSEYSGDRNENGGIVPGSRQIYLTFPAESAFSETDVSNYFNSYGPVQDVRIPGQEKRMFGFVTFVYPETVRKILSKGNPHFVCGARVLVKPYREKSRLVDRKHTEKVQRSMQYNSHLFDRDSEFHSMPSSSDYSRLMKHQFMVERKEALELEKTRLCESQLLPKPSARLQNFANSIDELKLAQEFPTSEQFESELNNLNNVPFNEDNFRNVNTNHGSQESDQVSDNLPQNLFAEIIPNSLSTRI